jgi:VWFA-related protein
MFSNRRPAEPADQAVILLDLLNTPREVRPLIAQAAMRYLERHFDSGKSIAVFALASDLTLLLDFTAERGRLGSAISGYRRTPADPKEQFHESDILEGLRAQGLALVSEGMIESMRRLEDADKMMQTELRIEATCRALEQIARFTGHHRRRKPLIWLSAAFPLFLQTSVEVAIYTSPMRRAASALNDAQLALYPIDVRGLMTDPRNSISLMPRNTRTSLVDKMTQAREISDPQDAMKEFAEWTGGRAFVNRNDLENAIAAGLDDGASYYELSYHPTNKRPDTRFRPIAVQVNRPGVELRYRKGYYMSPAPGPATDRERTASVRGKEIHFYVHPAAEAGASKKGLQLFVLSDGVSFLPEGNDWKARLQFQAMAYDSEGKKVFSDAGGADIKIAGADFARAAKSGFLLTIPVLLPPGDYRFRVGVRDGTDGGMGVLDFQYRWD